MSNIKLHTTPSFSLDYAGLTGMARMPPPASPCTYVVGDLHGNALKLFAFLLWAGLIYKASMPTAEDYNTGCIQQAYYEKNYKLFSNTIQNLRFNAQAVKNIKLIFIGDTLCDRGNSDYMTLLLYDLMAKNNINFTIIASNHDLGFIRQMERNTWRQQHQATDFDAIPNYSFDLDKIPADKQQNALRIYNEIYKPRLKIVDVDYADGKTIVYSHAPCDLQAIQSLSSISGNLIASINNINGNLAHLVMDYDLNPPPGNPLFDFVWNRNISKTLPDSYINVFGHIGEPNKDGLYYYEENQRYCNNKSAQNQINLDTNLGRHDGTQNSPNPDDWVPDTSKSMSGVLKVLQITSAATATDEVTQKLF